MTYEFFNKKPGEKVLIKESPEGVCIALIGTIIPEVVRLPTELGGKVSKVNDSFTGLCAHSECDYHHRHLKLDALHNGSGINVCECVTYGFLWYTRYTEH